MSGGWADLRPRVLSGAAMALFGAGAIWAGGAVLGALGALVTGLMIWELARLAGAGAGRAKALGGVAGLLSAAVLVPPAPAAGPLLLLVPPALFALVPRGWRRLSALYGAAVMLTGPVLCALRAEFGLAALLWLVGIVVLSDVSGYFAGRALGGPKFWPAVSPKKTWAGTAAGWLAAFAFGAGLAGAAGSGLGPALGVGLLSALLSLAGQMGDIAESALKRRAGIKDSSALIPGHGGVLDRFDALIGAALLLALAGALALAAGVTRAGLM